MRKTSIIESANFTKKEKYNQFKIQIGDILCKNPKRGNPRKYLIVDYDCFMVHVINVYSNNRLFRKVKSFTYAELEKLGYELS